MKMARMIIAQECIKGLTILLLLLFSQFPGNLIFLNICTFFSGLVGPIWMKFCTHIIYSSVNAGN